MNCGRCQNPLSGKQLHWCSKRCSKLGLKALYKKRNKEKVNAYHRLHRWGDTGSLLTNAKCRNCGTIENLSINHIIPRMVGGKNKISNYEVLCRSCNTKEYHALVKKALRYYLKI
jgi:5-methylcytosine-specific restriction endonuclease McrA